MTSFEQAIISALNNEYPMFPWSACIFHLSESIYQKVQELGSA